MRRAQTYTSDFVSALAAERALDWAMYTDGYQGDPLGLLCKLSLQIDPIWNLKAADPLIEFRVYS